MVFNDSFSTVPGNGSNIIDTSAKLRLATGRWNPESSAKGGAIDIVLFHDPKIEPTHLTMPPPDKVVRNRELLGAPPLKEVVFQSDQCREIAKITVDIDQFKDEVALIYNGGREPTFRYTARLIEMARAGVVSEHPWETVGYILKSMPKIPLWHENYAAQWGATHISVYVERMLADELARIVGFPTPNGDGDLVKIASRKVAA